MFKYFVVASSIHTYIGSSTSNNPELLPFNTRCTSNDISRYNDNFRLKKGFTQCKPLGKTEMKWYLSSFSFKKVIHQSKNLEKLGLYFQTDSESDIQSRSDSSIKTWKNWAFISKLTKKVTDNEGVIHGSKLGKISASKNGAQNRWKN